MMTDEKCREVIAAYVRTIEENCPGITPQEADETIRYIGGITLTIRLKLLETFARHLLAMIVRMDDHLQKGRREKFMRWLGFIQGALWAMGCFSLKELRSHLKPDDEPYKDSHDE